MFLASTSGVSELHDADKSAGMVGLEVGRKCSEGRSEPPGAAPTRLARCGRLGVRDGEAEPPGAIGGAFGQVSRAWSGCGGAAEIGRQFQPAFDFVRGVIGHAVIDSGPLVVAWVEFVVGQGAGITSAPSFGGKSSEHAGPAAVGIGKSVGVSGELAGGPEIVCNEP